MNLRRELGLERLMDPASLSAELDRRGVASEASDGDRTGDTAITGRITPPTQPSKAPMDGDCCDRLHLSSSGSHRVGTLRDATGRE
jgi:hypothetical protein